MEKLISMTDFVLEYSNTHKATKLEFHSMARRYAKFLKKPLTIGIFIPTDLHGNVLEEPVAEKLFHHKRTVDYSTELKEYREAKGRVLFEGFKLYKEKSGLTKVFNSESNIELYLPNNNKVERLAFGKIVLTESAKKQIGL